MFTSPVYEFMHPDYPILVPVYESVQFRAMGGLNTQPLHAQFWLLLVVFVWAVLYLGARRGALLTWIPITLAIGVAPGVYSQLMTAYADIPMALLLSLGVLLLAEWLRTDDAAMLGLAALILAASANTKNEGLVASVIALLVAAVIVAARRRRDRLVVLAAGAAGFLLGVLPWRIWVAVHHLPSEIPLGKAFDPSYLADRANRIWPSVSALYGQLADQNTWLYVLPLAAALVIASFSIGRRRDLATFFFATGALFFLALIWVYWVAAVEPLRIFLATSAYRLVAAIMAISLAALLEFTAPERRDEAEG
jgi:4-amino-4-deoxy-L-arabinose transferase-like glycosyltransferase